MHVLLSRATVPSQTLYFIRALKDIGFSNLPVAPNDMSECIYTPASGNDPNVRHICISPSGVFSSDLSDRSLVISFRARIK